VRSLSPADMAALLADGQEQGAHLALLARGGQRSGHDPRHASLAQVIAWSWRLLDVPTQAVLAALGVFPIDANAAFVAAVAGASPVATAMHLDDLVGHSLVRVHLGPDVLDGAPASPRFGLVEPVREFVAAQATAELAEARQARLRRCLVDWARSPGLANKPARVAPELPTVHAVLAQAGTAAAARDALDLALALRNYWDADGLPGRIQTALESALAHVADPLVRADAHEMLAYLRFEAGFVAQAQAHADAAIERAGQDPSRRARALVRRAWLDIAGGRSHDRAGPQHAASARQLDDALALARGCGDLEAQARALHQLATLAAHIQADAHGADLHKAEALMAQSQALWLQLGDRRKAMARLRNRAQCWIDMGRKEEARACFEHCEQAARDDGDWVGQIDSQISLTNLLAHERRWQEALAVSRRCIALAWQRWHRHGLAYALWNPPRLLARLHRPEQAMRLMGFAAAFWSAGFGSLSRADQQYVRRVRRLVQAQVGRARAEALWVEGASMDTASAVALALGD
jgi:tetratricopeptide (TPR) repeat protein